MFYTEDTAALGSTSSEEHTPHDEQRAEHAQRADLSFVAFRSQATNIHKHRQTKN